MSMFVYHKSFKDIFPVGFLSSNYLRKYGDDVVNYFPYMDFHFFFLSFQHFFSQKNWNERSLPVMFCRVHGFISNVHFDITNKYLGYVDFTFKNRFCFLSSFLINLEAPSKKITRQNFDSYRFFFNRNSYSSFFFFTLKPFFSTFYDYFYFKRELLINGLSIYSSRIRPFF